jgi:hypothetical protein
MADGWAGKRLCSVLDCAHLACPISACLLAPACLAAAVTACLDPPACPHPCGNDPAAVMAQHDAPAAAAALTAHPCCDLPPGHPCRPCCCWASLLSGLVPAACPCLYQPCPHTCHHLCACPCPRPAPGHVACLCHTPVHVRCVCLCSYLCFCLLACPAPRLCAGGPSLAACWPPLSHLGTPLPAPACFHDAPGH